jgi:hypothetical protein
MSVRPPSWESPWRFQVPREKELRQSKMSELSVRLSTPSDGCAVMVKPVRRSGGR